MPNLLETLQAISAQAANAGEPVELTFGTVTSTEPLIVQVGDKLLLSSKSLIVPQSLTTRAVDVSVSWRTDSGDGPNTQHSHSAPNGQTTTDGFSPTHTHAVSGKLSMTLHAGFSVGESLLLLKMQGGQRYLILDKAVSA